MMIKDSKEYNDRLKQMIKSAIFMATGHEYRLLSGHSLKINNGKLFYEENFYTKHEITKGKDFYWFLKKDCTERLDEMIKDEATAQKIYRILNTDIKNND